MGDRPLLILILITAVLAGAGWRWRAHLPSGVPRGVGRRRRWHPRTPDDCPCCRLAVPDRGRPPHHAPSVRPWAEIKSRRGAPKRQPTAGYACPTPACPYFGIADDRIHALIAYGSHGTRERIPDLRCQACGTKFTARYGTALYRLKTPSIRVGEVLSALAEGLDIGAAVRVFGHREAAIMAWLTRASQQAERLHEVLLRDLCLPHLQLDEIRTRLRARERVLWLWVAFDLYCFLRSSPKLLSSCHCLYVCLDGGSISPRIKRTMTRCA
jgi:hypothetical protein